MLKLALIASCAVLSLNAAVVESELKDSAGKTIIQYVVDAPEHLAPAGTTDPAKQVGLILCFPEHDRPVGDEILPVRAALERLGLRDQFVLVAGGPQTQKFNNSDIEPIGKLADWAKKTFPVNPRRVYMYGKGEGGHISGQIAAAKPDVVTAAVSYSWGWWYVPSDINEAIDPAKNTAEFYMVLGLRDLSYHLTNVRDAYARMDAKGHHIIYREFDNLAARTYHPESNGDAIAWISRLRNKMLPLSAGEQAILQRYAAEPPVPASGAFADLAVVGGIPAGAVIRNLLLSKDSAIRAAAAQTCSDAVFDESTMSALGKALTDPDPKVRRAATHALALQANWRSQAAQEALIAIATGAVPAVDPVTDRSAAVDGLIYAARYQLKGFRQDPPLFEALIALLKDKDEALRTMATNALAPIRDAEYRGDLGRAERAMPAGGWDAWLKSVRTQAAGYRADYEACVKPKQTTPALDLFCQTRPGGRGNPSESFGKVLQAAELGLPEAQSVVAMMYAVGKGVEQDIPKAAEWWTKAADQGNVFAASRAAAIYRGSPGVRANLPKSEMYRLYAADRTPNPDK